MFSLSGKVALVTGGGDGLGRVFCEALAEFGAAVSVMDLNRQGALETAEIVRVQGGQALAVEGDVSDPGDVDRMVEATAAHFGAVDILVNNAGINVAPARIAQTSIEDWDRVFGVNLRGVFLCTRACLPLMLSQGKGNVINVASILGVRPFPEIAGASPSFPYAVAKAGVIRLTKEIAAEYAGEGIRANCIAPGWHEGTRLSERWRGDSPAAEERQRYEEGIVKAVPMSRRGDPSELKGLVVYLASDASSFMTGQVLISDGGLCL